MRYRADRSEGVDGLVVLIKRRPFDPHDSLGFVFDAGTGSGAQAQAGTARARGMAALIQTSATREAAKLGGGFLPLLQFPFAN
jgi:hypothetical protein